MKELSCDRLVIVVTHDRESAESFGDVVIALKSGRVDEITRKETAQDGDLAEVRSAETVAPRAAGRKEAYLRGQDGCRRVFGRKAKCIVSVILSVLVLLCMEFALTANGERTPKSKRAF